MDISFSKYQATGNDFIVIDGLNTEIVLSESQVRELCDRHFGIGADGLIIARPSESAQFFMDYHNADGSKAEMCGNGVRCLVAFVIDNKIFKGQKLKVETRAGFKYINIGDNAFAVNMGDPSFNGKDIGFKGRGQMWKYHLGADGRKVEVYGVSVGNPHCIILSGDLESEPVEHLGPVIENHPLFSWRINVEWVHVKSEKELEVKVWERGSGLTLACGTGACAAFAVTNRLGLVGKKAAITLPGGRVTVELLNDNLILKGDAKLVFRGEIVI